MRTLVLHTLLSPDGVAAEPGDWMFDADQEVFDLADVIRSQDAVLLGRGTDDYWVDYWPTSEVEPFAGFINTTTKHVFTSTPPTTTWAGTQIVDSPPQEHVADLKRGPGGDIGVHGSLTLAQTLLHAGLVDELRLVVAPTLPGAGGVCSTSSPPRGDSTSPTRRAPREAVSSWVRSAVASASSAARSRRSAS